jgi:hypothetical protein
MAGGLNTTPVPIIGTYRRLVIYFAYSHSTPNTSHPHPSSGEYLSPPLGGAFADHLHLQVFERELSNADKSTQIAKYRLF